MRPILMGAAKANELHNIAVATAATIPIRFFMLSSPGGNKDEHNAEYAAEERPPLYRC